MKIIVVGGGPAGVAAAIAAKRAGKEVVLIEKYGFLGGMGTAGLVHPWMSHLAGDRAIIGGIFAEIIENLACRNALKKSGHLDLTHFCFDPEILKYLLQEMLLEAGVKIYFHSLLCQARREDGRIRSIGIYSKSGLEEVFGDFFIDATGDGDLLHLSDCPYEKDQMQPMSLHFKMGGVRVENMPDRSEINQLYQKAKDRDEIENPRDTLLWFDTVFSDQIHFNSTRIPGDGTRREDLTWGEIEGRRQMVELVAFLKKDVPGFENAYLLQSAAQVGVRETRRLKGKIQLTGDDIRQFVKFHDRIALGSYGIDIHSSQDGSTHQERLPEGRFYSIPFGSLIPQVLTNLLVAGRCLSADHEAFSAVRIQPICYAMGQAAGTAAALCLQKKLSPEHLDVKKLQDELLKNGAILE